MVLKDRERAGVEFAHLAVGVMSRVKREAACDETARCALGSLNLT